MYMGHSRPFRPGCDLYFKIFFFCSRMLWMTTKKCLKLIFRFFWKFLWQQWSKSSWNDGQYRFIWNLHHKFSDEENSFLKLLYHVQSFILGSTTKTKKNRRLCSRLRWNGNIPYGQIFFQCFSNLKKNVFHQLIKNNHFARAIARIRIRPFQLKSGEKYRMLYGRKVIGFQRV